MAYKSMKSSLGPTERRQSLLPNSTAPVRHRCCFWLMAHCVSESVLVVHGAPDSLEGHFSLFNSTLQISAKGVSYCVMEKQSESDPCFSMMLAPDAQDRSDTGRKMSFQDNLGFLISVLRWSWLDATSYTCITWRTSQGLPNNRNEKQC